MTKPRIEYAYPQYDEQGNLRQSPREEALTKAARGSGFGLGLSLGLFLGMLITAAFYSVLY